MDIPEPTEPTTEEDEIEITDLEMPIGGEKQQPARLQYAMLTWQRSLNRRRFRLLTTLCLLLLIALVVFANEQSGLAVLGSARNNLTSFLVQHHILPNNAPPAPLVIKPSVVISPQKDGFGCVTDTTWSPNSKYVALLGYQQNCAVGGSTIPGLLTIHDVSTGKRLRLLLLNDLVLHAFHSQYPKLSTEAVIYYQNVLWSHDEHHLAIVLGATFFHELQSPSFDGILLLDMNGGTSHVLLQPNQNNFLSYHVWDTQQGTEYIDPLNGSNTSQSPGYTIQPSPFYRWGNGGGANELLPVQSKAGPSSIPPSGAIGDPDGGNTFTLWQPGQLGFTTGNGNGTYLPGIATWSTYFAAWSPDGRYIVDNLLIDGRFNIPGRPIPNHQTLLALSMELLPLLPVRDKGLQRVLQIFASTFAQTDFIGASVAWRFDGRALAIFGIDATNNVNIYRCTDGSHVATLLQSAERSRGLSGGYVLRWSDDGSHVLLFNVGLGSVVIWNVPTTL